MPFKSEAQRRFLYSQKPEVAKEFAKKEASGNYVSSVARPGHGEAVSSVARKQAIANRMKRRNRKTKGQFKDLRQAYHATPEFQSKKKEAIEARRALKLGKP